MTFDEAYLTIPGNGWLSREEARLLWDAAAQCEGSILEVGCYQGRSTCLLARLGRPVYAVDPFDGFDTAYSGDELERMVLENLLARDLHNVTVYRQRIEDWTWRECGFAYLDGAHTYKGTLAQVDAALACGVKAVAVHDCNDDGGGKEVKRAAVERLGPWDERVERLAVWGNVHAHL